MYTSVLMDQLGRWSERFFCLSATGVSLPLLLRVSVYLLCAGFVVAYPFLSCAQL